MSNIITSCGTNAIATGLSSSAGAVFDGTNYWSFYGSSTQSGKLCYRPTSNLGSWGGEQTVSATNFPTSRYLATVIYNGSDTVLVIWQDVAGAQILFLRGVISGTTITWGTQTALFTSITALAIAGCLDSSSYPVVQIIRTAGGNTNFRKTLALTNTFTSTGNWAYTNVEAGAGTPTLVAIAPLGTDNLLMFFDEQDSGTIRYIGAYNWTGASWGTVVYPWAGANVPTNNWAVCQVTATGNPYIIDAGGSSTLVFSQWNGSSFTAKAAPTWPTNGLATTAALALASDGTDVYVFAIRGDANTTIASNHYSVSGDTWGGWTNLEASSQVRSDIQAGPYVSSATPTIVPIWTQVNGSNYEIWAATPGGSFTASPAAIPANHSGSITLTLTGTGTSWTSGSTVTVQNSVTGTTIVTKGTWTQSSGTAATLTVTTGAGTGTFTITVDGLVSSSLTVDTASFTISPTTNSTGQTTTVTATGTNTLWSSESASTLFSVSGGTGASISGTPSVTSNTAATFSLVDGSAAGTLTITDAPTTDTATFSVTPMPTTATLSAPSSLSGNVGAASGSFTITLDHPAPIGGIVCTITDSVSNSEIS